MSSSLRLDWATHEAATYAVTHWHYSKSMPAGKVVKVGVWEAGRFVGCVLFSRGASDAIGRPYSLRQTEVAELTRIALTQHATPVSRIMAIAVRLLKTQSIGLRLLVSYADPTQGHIGGIYQAANWLFVGETSPDFYLVDASGKRWHSRMISPTGYKISFGKPKRCLRPDQGVRVEIPGKRKYLMPLDPEMRAKVAHLAKPYPKRVKQATTEYPSVSGGAAPTHTLQSIGENVPTTLRAD